MSTTEITEDTALAETRAMAVELMTQYELYGWSFHFDRAERRGGQTTTWRNGRPGTITLSGVLMPMWTPEQRRETMLHEIAHALSRGARHDSAEFHAVCARIGADPARKAGEDVEFPPWRYTGHCPNGHPTGCDRLPRGRDPRRSCTVCAPRFDTRFLITWELS